MNFNQVIKFLNYKLFSKHKKGYGIHSPFVFDLITNVFCEKTEYAFYNQIEARRKDLLHSDEIILLNDFGALKSEENRQIKISLIAKKSLKSRKFGQLLYKLTKYYNYKNILELGTSFGISTSYLSSVNKNAKITTIEGCKNISKIAKETFDILNLNNINIVTDNFDNVLPKIIDEYKTLDLVFFDGNHKKEPTLKYFNTCLNKINKNSVFIFDDIYWSKEMENAWKIIIQDPRSKITIDIFSLGLVFFKENVEKQHFVIRY